MRELHDESTKQVITEQVIQIPAEADGLLEMATDLFIRELQSKATPGQLRRLLVLLEEIQLSDAPAIDFVSNGAYSTHSRSSSKICA